MDKFLIKNPIITEKATQISSLRKYIFLVNKKATKQEIRKALKSIYKVDAEDVNVINVKKKIRRLGRSVGVKPGYKKAVVTLKEGQKLDILPH